MELQGAGAWRGVVCGLWFEVCGLRFVVCGLWFEVCGLSKLLGLFGCIRGRMPSEVGLVW